MLIVGIVIAVLAVLIIAGCFYFAGFALRIRGRSLEEARAWQEEHYDLSWYDPLEKEDYTVTSYDGYVLHAQLLKNPGNTNRYVITSHGYTDNRFGTMKYAAMYLEQGFNVIAYDLRGHGLNEPTFTTYSIREGKDLNALILDSRKRYPNASLFGIHGESLGAATTVASLKEKPPIDFAVADCGFCEITPVIKTVGTRMHLPVFLVGLVSAFAKLRFGYSFGEMRPIDALQDNTIPIVFFHGADDDFIPPEHSKRMKEATKGYTEIHLIPRAEHAMSILTDPKGYRAFVANFLATQFPGR